MTHAVGKPESVQSASRGQARAWLELLRLPNLLTVPGDPIAGYLLAAGAAAAPDRRLLAAVLASLLFYSSGLILNDVADLQEDRAERPRRPLPSGRISVPLARGVGFFLMALALGLCTWLGPRGMAAGAALCATILAYNLGGKRMTLLGPLLMGLCRSLNLVLGAALVGSATTGLVVASGCMNAYIVLVTYLARDETKRRRRGWVAWLPVLTIVGGMAAFLHTSATQGPDQMRMAGAFFLAFLLASFAALRLQDAQDAPGAIGLLIGALPGLQSAFALGANAGPWSLAFGFVLLAMIAANRLLARWVHAS